MVNILDLLKDQMGSAIMDKVAGQVGISGDAASSALGSMVPSILGGLISKGSSAEGASGILDFLNKEKMDGSMFDNLGGMLGDSGKMDGMMKLGGLILPFILGGKKAGFMNILSNVTGLGSGKTSSLLSIAAPMVMGMIGKQVKKSGLNASGLMNLLGGQKEHVAKALPAGMGDMLGFAGNASKHVATATESSSSGGMLKWLLPLALLALGGWYFGQKGCAPAGTADNSETKGTTTTTSTAAHNNSDHTAAMPSSSSETSTTTTTTGTNATTTVKDAANAATTTVKDGAESLTSAAKTAAAEAATDVKATVDGATKGRSLEEFKTAFVSLLEKKTDVSSGYNISKMTFDPKSQRISYYSKEEFMGLAAALKAKADSKITVQVHTNDGKNESENKRLSSMRAEQIKAMLTTMGVKAKQMSFKGMGSGDAAKAASNAINIKVK